MYQRVAIIGGGAAATALIGELLDRSAPHPLHLDWYTGADAPGRGIAYATCSPRHLLNVRAASMGMFAGRPQGFLDFVQSDDPAITGTAFLPRHRYGDYLEAEIVRALAAGKRHGHDVHILPFAADAVVPEADAVTVFHADQARRVDAAVLATGSLPPHPLPGVAAAAQASGRYVVDPWPWLAAPPDTAPARVAIVGTGLTAADIVVELAARWPDTRFTAISPHGAWPQPHSTVAALPSGDGSDLFEAMGEDADVHHWLGLVREAAAQEEDWRSTVDSLRPHAAALWALLPLAERARFLRHLRWAWERVRHRLPVPTAGELAALERGGRLARRRARVAAVEVDGEGLRVRLRSTTDAAVQAAWVIQATGPDYDVAHTAHPLLHQLVLNQHVLPDPLGLGCQATPDGRLRHADGVWSRLFAIGGLLRGTLWETTAMPEIRQQARSVANQLLAETSVTPDP